MQGKLPLDLCADVLHFDGFEEAGSSRRETWVFLLLVEAEGVDGRDR